MSAAEKAVSASIRSVLMVPDDGEAFYPSLGPLICDWMEESLVFGPGDLLGEPLVLDDERRAFIYRFYELIPEGHKGEGRRRFRRCGLSQAKGCAKSELGALISAAELADDAPVRFDGWDGQGNPKGRPLKDPFVAMVAVTEEQSDELAYGALRTILAESPIAGRFDIGLERIMRADGHGKAVSLAGSPNARDGARTTFSLHDETHWLTSDKHKRAHTVMLNNLAKRKIAEAWSLEVTTAYEPGAGSIAEQTMDYARAVHEGRAKDAKLFFFHRQASEDHDLDTEEGARAAVIEASGPAAVWRDIDAIVAIWASPSEDRKFWERVWCNRPVQSTRKAFDLELYRKLEKQVPVPDGSMIALGFDGAQKNDSTAIVATDIQTGHQWLAGLWEKPHNDDNWQVPSEEVDACIDSMFSRFNVWRLYADPPYWQSWLSHWQGEYGDERVIEWWSNRRRQMAAALESFDTATSEGSISHDGNEDLIRHIGNAHRHNLPQRNDEARPVWLIRKERSDSPYKIDAAMAAVLSWEARKDAIASGVLQSDGTKFEASWLKYWTKRPEGGNRYILVDPANEKRKKSAYSVFWVIECRDDNNYYAIDCIRDQLDLSARVELLLKLHREHQPLRVGYEEYGLEADEKHIKDRQERENYRFHVAPLGGKLSEAERIKRLVPLFQSGRFILPEILPKDLANGQRTDMTQVFVREEYATYPLSAHTDMLECASRILDIGADFPAISTWQPPDVWPSEFS